ncbi:MAG: protein-glutamate O-methyltransferase CheR [Terriglobales bacterium]|jgi:chemotaxis protein methyltransferase CheR
MSARDESISNADFGRLRSLIYEQSGINLNAEKKTMLELRIKRRLRSLDLNSFAQYCEYLFGPHGQKEEIVHLLDVVSTNKTDFFREPEHFEFLVQKAIPELMARNQSGRPLLVWSAGCSTGEEPYTLAMVLNECALAQPGFRFRVLATDISTTVLAKAGRGVFSVEVVGPVPADLRRKYFMRSRDRDSNLLRVVPELRQLVEFRRLNFMDADFGLSQKVDVIFCRNVIIYFDRATQEQIIQKLAAQLVPGGYAFVGHSETLHDMDIPLAPVAPAIYRKKEDAGN